MRTRSIRSGSLITRDDILGTVLGNRFHSRASLDSLGYDNRAQLEWTIKGLNSRYDNYRFHLEYSRSGATIYWERYGLGPDTRGRERKQ